jgi:hypothetical protein
VLLADDFRERLRAIFSSDDFIAHPRKSPCFAPMRER